MSPLLDPPQFILSRLSNILAGVAGITSDANSLVNYARNACQRHLLTYDEEIPVEMLAKTLCDMKQGYTQFGGMSLSCLRDVCSSAT